MRFFFGLSSPSWLIFFAVCWHCSPPSPLSHNARCAEIIFDYSSSYSPTPQYVLPFFIFPNHSRDTHHTACILFCTSFALLLKAQSEDSSLCLFSSLLSSIPSVSWSWRSDTTFVFARIFCPRDTRTSSRTHTSAQPHIVLLIVLWLLLQITAHTSGTGRYTATVVHPMPLPLHVFLLHAHHSNGVRTPGFLLSAPTTHGFSVCSCLRSVPHSFFFFIRLSCVFEPLCHWGSFTFLSPCSYSFPSRFLNTIWGQYHLWDYWTITRPLISQDQSTTRHTISSFLHLLQLLVTVLLQNLSLSLSTPMQSSLSLSIFFSPSHIFLLFLTRTHALFVFR